MFKADAEIMAQALECVLGKTPVPTTKEGNEELLKVLACAGIAMVDKKGGVTVFKSRNMLSKEGTIFLSDEQVKFWKELNFTMPFQLRGRGRTKMDVHVEKIPGDLFATVADSNGNHIFGSIVVSQDSRSPWLLFDGDTRKFSLQFTNKQMPNDRGICAICTGWGKKTAADGRTSYLYDNNYEIWSCTKIVRKILTDYFGMVFEHVTSDLNNTERASFIRAGDGVFYVDSESGMIEISKEVGTGTGDILVGEEKIGSVTIAPEPKSFGVYKAEISFSSEKTPEERVAIENAVWGMLCPQGRSVYSSGSSENNGIDIDSQKSGFKKNKKFKGKKQFAARA